MSYTYNGVRCVQVSDCALMRKLDTMIFVERWPLHALFRQVQMYLLGSRESKKRHFSSQIIASKSFQFKYFYLKCK